MSTTIKRVHGYLAEFASANDLAHAAEKVRDAGFKKWDVYTPYAVHGMDAAMGLGRSKLPYFVFFGGLTGFITGFLLAYVTQVVFYATVVQSKPTNVFTIPAFFPPMFELTILFSAFTTLFGVLAFMGLPRLHHPIFESKNIKRATDDAYLLCIEARDPQFSKEKALALLEGMGGKNIELVEESIKA